MEIGQKYRVRTAFGADGIEKAGTSVGKVVYIHPKGRYAVLSFKGALGESREAFPCSVLTADKLVRGKRDD